MLLGAVIDRFAAAAVARLTTTVEANEGAAIDKLQHFFSDTMAWKTARKELLLELLRVGQSDENAVVRDQLRRNKDPRITP